MKVTDITLEVRDKNLQRVGIIAPKDFDFEITDLHNDVGAYTITVAADHPMAATLRTPGAGIVFTVGGITFSGPVQQPEYSANQEEVSGKVVVKGLSDVVLVADALAFPQPGNSDPSTQTVAYDEASGTAEDLLHWYVSRNIGPGGSTARKNRNLVMGQNLGRGSVFSKKPRFQVLGDLLNEIAAIDGMGYNIVQRDGSLVFETYKTEDRRKAVRLSLFNNELEGQTVATSAPGVTRAIVGGQGELISRKFREVTTPESLNAEAEWGRRIERFVDEKSTNLNAELQKAGEELLADEGFSFASVQTIPVEDSSLVFGTDYHLGDIVSIEVDGAELTTIVTGYIIKADADGVRVGLVLGDPNDFAQDGGVVRQLTQVTRRVNELELASPTTDVTDALDTRIDVLEARGPSVHSRYMNDQYTQTNIPNDGNDWTAYSWTGISWPAGATMAQITLSWSAHNVANAACYYKLLLSDANGNWYTHFEMRKHNQANAALDMGGTYGITVNRYEARTPSGGLNVALNVNNDPGSAAWMHMGVASLQVSFIGNS